MLRERGGDFIKSGFEVYCVDSTAIRRVPLLIAVELTQTRQKSQIWGTSLTGFCDQYQW
jgi:hypothetical protein